MMKTISRNILSVMLLTVFSLTLVSCIPHLRGNGKVVKEERKVSDFEALDVSMGVEVLVTQDSIDKVVVEVDSNLLKVLKTRVSGDVLKIYLEEGVFHAKSLKVYVTVRKLRSVETGSGSNVKSENKINAEKLKLSTSSGSGIKMEVNCGQVTAESSSGSNLTVSGTAQSLKANTSSGAGINASELVADMGDLSASSGSHLKAQVAKEVKAHASSGASITVAGNPAVRDTDSSSGGSVHFK